MANYCVIALTDISKPQRQTYQHAIGSGRILEINNTEKDENEHESASSEKHGRCFKFVLVPENADGPMTNAFELVPLPYSATQLLGSSISVIDAEVGCDMLLLTPDNTTLLGEHAQIIHDIDESMLLDDEDMVAFLNDAVAIKNW